MASQAGGQATIAPAAPSGGDPARAAARQFVAAVAARDFRGMFDLLARDAALRYLIPSGPGAVTGAAEVVARYTDWFGDADAVEVRGVLIERMADRTSTRYQFRTHADGAWELVEQQAYLDVDPDGRIARLDVLCSGFRPAGEGDAPGAAALSGVHHFDAGAMGCADGLADEFRRRIGAIPLGDVLVVVARDPAAKEDLPPLARMLGQTVRSTEATGDGRHQFTIERTR